MKPVLLILAVCLVPVSGWAQVIVHQAALDQLAGIAVPAPPAVKPAPRVFHYRLLHRVVARAAKPKPALAVAKPKAPPPVVSVVAPPAVMPAPTTLPPMPWVPVPGAPTKPPVQLAVVKPPPPPRPVMPAVTVGFAPGGADLTAGAPAALQPVCKAAHDNGYVSIDAYAPADSTDPSAAMRLSLSRAFAVREALIKCGLPLARLIPRADGAMGHDTGIARITVSGGMAQ